MTKNDPSEGSFHVIAIDGGAASGKSSTSRVLAERLNLLHVDTGSHYRAIALVCLDEGIEAEEGDRLRDFLDSLRLESRLSMRESSLCFHGRDRPDIAQLRSERVNRVVSAYAALDSVRAKVKSYQRGQVDLARQEGFAGIVMDGRDIGTVILPGADLKVFLRADANVRQHRRLREGGVDAISSRDQRDSTRAIAPLKPADDAFLIDNSELSLEDVVSLIIAHLNQSETHV